MYFFIGKFAFNVPCNTEKNNVIHNSNVPSKHSRTVASSTPSKGENDLIISNTKYSNLARACSSN